jgi:hypothetical protein
MVQVLTLVQQQLVRVLQLQVRPRVRLQRAQLRQHRRQ